MIKFEDRLIRQFDLIPADALNKRVLVVGAGAVGSFTVLTLAKMGISNITVVDFDTIDVANMNCQFYRTEDINKPKVVALHSLVKAFTDVAIKFLPIKIDEKTQLGEFDIVISAVDSMSVRKLLWEKYKGKGVFFLDARMGGESILMYSIKSSDAKDITDYETTLYSDDDAVAERCTAKATMYTVNLIAGLMGKAVKDFITNNSYTRIVMWNVKENAYLGFNKE